jgi:hypothetical protein
MEQDARLALGPAVRTYWVNLAIALFSLPATILGYSVRPPGLGTCLFGVVFFATSIFWMWPTMTNRVRKSYYRFAACLWLSGILVLYPVVWALDWLHVL